MKLRFFFIFYLIFIVLASAIVISSNPAGANSTPTIRVIEPLDQNVSLRVEDFVKFEIESDDPDPGDTLMITWYFDGLEVGSATGSNSYTFEPDESDIGDHIVEVVVTDSYENVSYKWNVKVKDSNDAQGLVYGMTWDQWDIITTIIGAVVFVIIVVVIVKIVLHFEFRKRKREDK